MKKSKYEILYANFSTSREILHGEVWELVKSLPTEEFNSSQEAYEVMRDIGKIAEALLAMREMDQAEIAVHRAELRRETKNEKS